jgi:hypothetical protein
MNLMAASRFPSVREQTAFQQVDGGLKDAYVGLHTGKDNLAPAQCIESARKGFLATAGEIDLFHRLDTLELG